MEETQRFDEWAIVEVFGHQKLAGRVTEQAVGGASFVRIDVPAFDGQPAFTRLYGAAAIYSITPVTEELARKAAQYCRAEPVTVYIPQEKQLPAPDDPAKPATVDPENAHDCANCGSPCDCGYANDCCECTACTNDPEGDDDPENDIPY